MLEIFFNELYYIYKDKYNEEKDGLNAKNKKTFLLQKIETCWWLYKSEEEEEEEEEKEQQTSKKPDKKEPLKKSTKNDWIKFNE